MRGPQARIHANPKPGCGWGSLPIGCGCAVLHKLGTVWDHWSCRMPQTMCNYFGGIQATQHMASRPIERLAKHASELWLPTKAA